MVHTAAILPSDEDVFTLPVRGLTIDSSFRDGGLHEEHVERLVGLRGYWPPILVSRESGDVIDGVHRVAAARQMGLAGIEATYFDGTVDEALIEFVRRNVYHGLPLTLRERKRAARRVLHAHAQWSDRRIAELCAISPKTVGRLRLNGVEGRGDGPVGEVPHLDATSRVGRDNKSHPVNTTSIRGRVAEAIKEQPGASLRTIAASVGVSPETVRSVRISLNAAPDAAPVTDPASIIRELALAPPPLGDTPWKQDQAIATSLDGDDFLAWFERTTVNEADWWCRVETMPVSRIYEIADEARRRSEVWMRFARSLEERTRKRR